MSACKTFFVTGIDTGIGKTQALLALMCALQNKGFSVSGMKPVASGASSKQGQLRNEDAVLIQGQCSQPLEYCQINPYPLTAPVSPHFAAELDDTSISLDLINRCARQIQEKSEYLFIEGIGGWRVPWGEDLEAKHLAKRLNIPVILVVGLKSGCINHALLTREAIQYDGIGLTGWIANHIDPAYQSSGETIDFLCAGLSVPLIGVIPYMDKPSPETGSRGIQIDVLTNHPGHKGGKLA